MSSSKTKSFRHRGDQAPEAAATDQPTSFWRRLFGGKPVQKEKLAKHNAGFGSPGKGGKPADKRAGSSAATVANPPAKHAPNQAASHVSTQPTNPGPNQAASPAPRPDPRPANPGTGALPMSSMPLEGRPRNPKSFLAKKFNSQVVKAALLDAIGAAMDKPPAGIDPIESKFWIEGLAFKGMLVEKLDCAALKPEEHLRAIQWMAKVERANPVKATYREDLFGLKFQMDTLDLKDAEPPEAVAQGGVALRRFYQVIKTKIEGLGKLSGEGSAASQKEIAAYERIMEAIERAPIARLEKREQMLLANVYRRLDPYRIELTTRHARFDHNVDALIAEMEDLYAQAASPTGA